MLEHFEKAKSPDKGELKAEIKALRARLLGQQQLIREKKLPVIVLVEGWAAAGKGGLINELISEIDPRFYNVVSPVVLPEAQERYPFLYPYAQAIPENGKIMFYDSGWMEGAVRKYLRREITKEQYKARIRAVDEFERQLRDGGYLVLKLFLHISRKEQHTRLAALKGDPATEWRVTEDDLMQQREYALFYETYDKFMDKTNAPIPWHLLDGGKRRVAVRDALRLLVGLIDQGLEQGKYVGKPFQEKFPLRKMPRLAEVDLSPAIEDEAYKKELKKLQKRLSELHNIVYRKRIPVVLCYEGWDAAGKGG
ncbi:MAG: phosphate--AMP phosphotransferase, partial [Oscillospiraceae bacterium]|nr:phosphate--AMP phosphotransferase [Oscillospiraceae bacterium]